MTDKLSESKKPYDWQKNERARIRYSLHKNKQLVQQQKYYQENKTEIRLKQNQHQKTESFKLKRRLYMSRYSKENRIKLINLLGGKCMNCPVNDFRVLQLDHQKGTGITDLKIFGRSLSMYRYYLKNPEKAKQELQVLCANCNIIKKYENNEIRYYFDMNI